LVLISTIVVPSFTLGGLRAASNPPVLTAFGAERTLTPSRGFLIKPSISAAVPQKHEVQTYSVVKGDSLAGISDQFGISIDTLRWANNLSHLKSLSLGEKLLIPPVDGVLLTTKAGDTVNGLAAKYSVAANVIIEYNLIRDPDHVAPGTQLMLPSGAGESLQSRAVSSPGNARSGGSVADLGPVNQSAGPNHFPWGQCTWYVASRRYVPWNGNAWSWYGNAQAYGYAVGQVPRAGAIMVSWESWWGHVAYVEAVDGRCWTITEMNYGGFARMNRRTICPGQLPLIGFIY
jgi:surface antigen